MTTANPTVLPTGRAAKALLDALRSNTLVLGELAMRYGIETHPERPPSPPVISTSDDVRRLLGREMAALAQEQLRVLLLDSQNRLVGQRVIYQGNISSVTVRTAEVLRPAVVEAVPSLILVHNHPSADPNPSAADIAVTRDVERAAGVLDLAVLDHVVIGGEDFVSFKDRGILPFNVLTFPYRTRTPPHAKGHPICRNHRRPWNRSCTRSPPAASPPPPTPSPGTPRATASGSSPWSAPRRRSRRSGPRC